MKKAIAKAKQKPMKGRPQVWLTKHPFDDSKLPQLDIVYPTGKYEYYSPSRSSFLPGKEQNFKVDKTLDIFIGNL